MTLFTVAIFIIGLFVSGFGTLIGFGGGVFMVPILVVLFGVKIQLAIGGVALALVPATLIASLFNAKGDLIDYKAALLFEIPTMMGAALGAYLTAIIPVHRLEIIFAIFLLYFAFSMIFSKDKKMNQEKSFWKNLHGMKPQFPREKRGVHYVISLPAAILFGGSSGVLAGLFGVGGGFMKTPIMIKIFKMPSKVAVATALLMIVFTSLTSSITHIYLGHIDWSLCLPLISGFSLGALLGNLGKKHISDMHTEKLIGIGLGLAGLSILFHSIS